MNIALRRAAKANRRKAVIADRRNAEALVGTLDVRVRRAAAAPIQHCLLPDALFENGVGTLVLTRRTAIGQLVMSAFLLDVFCLGIKDLIFRPVGAQEFAMFADRLEETSPMKAVDPAYARKLLRDLAGWAKSIGFAPHRDFAAVEQIFGDVSADACDAVFHFGHDGKPFYMAGPSESPSLIRRRIEHLRQQLGDEGFHYLVPA